MDADRSPKLCWRWHAHVVQCKESLYCGLSRNSVRITMQGIPLCGSMSGVPHSIIDIAVSVVEQDRDVEHERAHLSSDGIMN